MEETYYRIDCCVPCPHPERGKSALFCTGAGYGNHRNGCFSFPGEGEFCPEEGKAVSGQGGNKRGGQGAEDRDLLPGKLPEKNIPAMLGATPYETAACRYFPVQITIPER